MEIGDIRKAFMILTTWETRAKISGKKEAAENARFLIGLLESLTGQKAKKSP